MRLTRRYFIKGLATAAAESVTPAFTATGVPKFRLLYSNDATNIMSCISPYHRRGEKMTPAMIQSSINEAARADAQILQPGLGWVPFWRSETDSITNHAEWVAQRLGVPASAIPNSFLQYMLDGHDIAGEFVDHCRLIGCHPILSLRLNDVQRFELRNRRPDVASNVSRFYEDHPEYRIGPEGASPRGLTLNWAIPEVRADKLRIIREWIDGYDVAGIELDFMRGGSFFRTSETTVAERREILTSFIASVRDYLDRKTGGIHRLALCVRVPAIVDFHDDLGIHINTFARAGVDVFTLSSSFYTVQRADIEIFRLSAPGSQLFLEMTHTVAGIRNPLIRGDPGNIRTADLQFLTTAREAVQRGADGVALFNFVYFRTQVSVDPNPGREPPFHLLPQLAQPSKIAKASSWWFAAQGWGVTKNRADSLPRWLFPNQPFVLEFYCERQSRPAILRIRSTSDLAQRDVGAEINGVSLTRIEPISDGFPTSDTIGLGNSEQYAWFNCPREPIRTGINRLSLSIVGEESLINQFDLLFA